MVIDTANYEFFKVVELANGDYLAMGATNDALGLVEPGYASISAVKIDSDGNAKWQKAYGLQDKKISLNVWDAEENDDGTISIWGNHTVGGGYPVMIELILNENGNILDYFLITDDLALVNSVRATDCAMIKTDDGGLLAYQINPSLAAAKMYQHFANNKGKIVDLKDLSKGYMDYNAAATASLMAQIKKEPFDINAYFGGCDAKLYEGVVTNMGIVDKEGKVTY